MTEMWCHLCCFNRGSVQIVASHLHPDDGVDEEQHGDKQADVRQGLEANTHTKMSSSATRSFNPSGRLSRRPLSIGCL